LILKNLWLVSCLLFLVLEVGCSRGLRLADDDDKANTHMAKAIDAKNAATRFLNSLSPGQGQMSNTDLEKLTVDLAHAALEARQVTPVFMDRVHPRLRENWQGAFLPCAEGMLDYYTLSTTSAAQPPSRIVAVMADCDRWGDWYSENRENIRAGIRRLAS
jgi:hypothetical protein